MDCPKCSAELGEYILKDINVERCPQCKGTWLDFEELDELEDSVFDKDSLKGSIILKTIPGNLKCPSCGRLMKKFNYRLYDLELDYCEEHHGFWLDKGEEDRIIATMKEEVKRTARGFALEDDWPSVLKNLRSKSLVSLVRELFRG
jgi:Zn-finger nucleic acid-binding protein